MLDHKCGFTAIIALYGYAYLQMLITYFGWRLTLKLKKENETTNSMNFDR